MRGMAKEFEVIEERDEPTRIGGIDYPDEVIRALLERRLVVFAGAGVSMDPPTSLPNFDGLVREFEASTRKRRGPRETIDQYLGSLKSERGAGVHAEVVRMLGEGEPKPNANHENLLKLFGSSEAVRLVTTNFDLMFEEAAETLGWKVKSYTAPAVPMARDFRGIVHLHGSIEDETSMVLTKGDFGGAYTQPGWATTFLADLVRGSTVLFVGYSGSDILPDYLLTTIHETSDNRLFMLRNRHDEPIDQQSGIDVVQYKSSSRDDHSTLTRSLCRLGTLFHMDMTEWRYAIKVATASPGFDRESDEEAVALALRNEETTRYFADAANDFSWVEWLEGQNCLEAIFTDALLSKNQESLAHLVARLGVHQNPRYLVRMLGQHQFKMSPCLWEQLILAIRGHPMNEVSLAQWVTMLLEQPIDRMTSFGLTVLASECEDNGDVDAGLLLYGFLSAPRYVGDQFDSWGFDDCVRITEDTVQQTEGSLALQHCADMMEGQHEDVRRQIVEIGIWSFAHRHALLKIWGKASDDNDPWSTVYDSINRPDSREQPEGFDLLCVVTRQQIHSLVKLGGDYADGLVSRLIASPVPILRRLAVDAVRVREDMHGVNKARWLMDSTRVSDLELVSELSRLLEVIFSDLGGVKQQQIVKWLLDGEIRQGINVGVVNAKQSRWLWLLKRSDPTSESAEKELRGLKRRDPNAYAHPYPERPVGSGEAGYIHHPEPFTVDELISAPPSSWVDALISWRRPGGWIWSDERRGLKQIVQQVCVREFGWGNDLARGLIGRKDLSTDLWQSILAAWHDESCAVGDWSSVLDSLAFVLERKDLSRGIAWVLVRFAKDAEGSDLFERANRLAAEMWRNNSGDAEGWLGNGLLVASWNSAAGQVPMYWVEVAKRLRNGSVKSDRMAAELKSEVSKILRPDSQQSKVGKVTLGAWYHVFSQLDADWAEDELVPMFVTSQDGFEAAWEGFLWTFQCTEWMPDSMLAHFEGAIANRQRINTDEGMGIARVVSYLCCTREPGVSNRLFQVLCATADDAESLGHDVADFVIGIRSLLRRMDVQNRTRLWESWLREHLARRRNGIPRGMVDGELWELLTLIPVMLPAVPEIVDVLIDFPLDESETNNFSMIFHRVDVDDFPREYTKLMLYLDRYQLDRWQWDYNKEHVDKLIANEAVPSDQRKRLQDLKFKYMID